MNMMVNLRATYLSPEEIDKIVSPLLTKDFEAYGYKDKSIKEDETFDGEPIIRVRANVEKAVPADEMIATLSRIHDALRSENDERFVFLSAPGPEAPVVGGVDEEDAD
ncbi:hypothetical protein OE766_23835 [Pararhizobium sp. YC-54]|uniref:hypothetical protein n=1 Tax=Pararhizobium sp. YC-54 TaxID=2986920 RepID=UPI0021F7E5E6|nr:hypothetical protein [Pararhizobium sp. YC-54]MCW0001257.1 hypothetical protein [Pararhizobium sp. YC-54]